MVESVKKKIKCKNFEIVHQLKNQLRIKVPCLHQDPERAYILENLLKNREGIENVQAVPEIASVAIYFDPAIIPADNVLTLFKAVLTNIGNRPAHSIQKIQVCTVDKSISVSKLKFAIKGMACSSCALFLEMLFKRDPCIDQVNVDYDSATAEIIGRLSVDTICEMVQKQGYDAELISEEKPDKEGQGDIESAQDEPVLSIWL